MAVYQYQWLADGGVLDLASGRTIRYREAGWDAWQAHLTAGGTALPPDSITQLPAPEAKARRTADINARAAAIRNEVVAGTSPAEMAAWIIKLLDAMAVSAGQPSPFVGLLPALATALSTLGITLPRTATSVNDMIALVRGITEAEHVGRVLTPAVGTLALEIALDGYRGRLCDQVAACPDTDRNGVAVALIPWLVGWPQVPTTGI